MHYSTDHEINLDKISREYRKFGEKLAESSDEDFESLFDEFNRLLMYTNGNCYGAHDTEYNRLKKQLSQSWQKYLDRLEA